MRITVYVPCHNNETTVAEALVSIRQQSRPPDQCLFNTLRLPWARTIRDLHALRATAGEFGAIREVVSLAQEVLTSCGFDADFVMRVTEWLEELDVSLGDRPSDRGPLPPMLLAQLRLSALESIPDLNYLRRCRE